MGIQINGSNDTIQADDGSLSLAGSVSYEDVTNVTSVGLSTFSSGIHIDDSITHLGDTDTKIRFPAADTISAETGGDERLRIFASGAIQLTPAGGTANANGSFDTSGDNFRINAKKDGSGGCGFIFQTQSSGSLAERVRITSAGNFGIGDASPARPLSVSSNQISARFTSSSTDSQIEVIDSSGTVVYGSASGNAIVQAGGSERLRVNSSGEVSIGTVTGGKTLTLFGTSSSSFRISKSGVLAYDHTFDGSSYTIANNNGSAGIPIIIGTKTAGAESLRIDSSGRMLIGTSVSPSAGSGQYANLVVQGYTGGPTGDAVLSLQRGLTANQLPSGASLGSVVFGYSNGTTAAAIIGRQDGAGGTNDYPGRLVFSTTADSASSVTERMRIDSSGVVTIGTTAAGSNAKFEVASTTGSLSSATARINGGETTSGAVNTGASILFAGHDGANGRDFASLFAGKENGTSGNHAAYLAFGTRVNSGSITEKMRIDSSGNIAIGTATALSSSGYTGITASGSSGGIYWFAKAGAQKGYITGRDNDVTLASTDTLGIIRLFTGGNTERMRIDSDGIVQLGNGGFGQTKVGGQSISGQDYSATVKIYDTRANMWGMQMRRDTGTGPNGIFVRAGNTSSNYSLYVCGTNESDTHLVCRGDGNVGMGVNSPSAKLHVNVASNNPTTGSPAAGSFLQVRADDATVGNGPSLALMNLSGAKETAWRISAVTASGNNGDLTFHGYAGGTTYSERMRIDSAGRLLVGATSAVSNDPVLQVKGYAGQTAGAGWAAICSGNNLPTANENIALLSFMAGNGNQAARIEAEADANHSSSSTPGRLGFFTTQSGVTGPTERMRIDSSGKVLINTTSAGSDNSSSNVPLQVVAGTGAYGITVRMRNTHNDYGFITFASNNGNEQLANVYGYRSGTNAGNIIFSTNNGGNPTERMRIDSTGQTAVYRDTSTTGVAILTARSNYVSTNRTQWYVLADNGQNENRNGVYTSISSDERLKKDITDASSQWTDIKNIRMRKFRYKSDSADSPLQLGVVAQELESVCPNLVTRKPATAEMAAESDGMIAEGEDLLSWKQSIVHLKALKALQEAMDRIETLEARVAALEG